MRGSPEIAAIVMPALFMIKTDYKKQKLHFIVKNSELWKRREKALGFSFVIFIA